MNNKDYITLYSTFAQWQMRRICIDVVILQNCCDMDSQWVIFIARLFNDVPCFMKYGKVIPCLSELSIPVSIALHFKVEFGNLMTVLFMSGYLCNAFIVQINVCHEGVIP